MSANVIVGKRKMLNAKPESEEILNYSFIFHKILMYL